MLRRSSGDTGSEESDPLLGLVSSKISFWRECTLMLSLGTPIFVGRAAWTVMKTTDSAFLGHVGTQFLASQSLADLWIMIAGIFLHDKILRVLCAQARGRGEPHLMVAWLFISYAVLAAVTVPIAAFYLSTEYVMSHWLLPESERSLAPNAGLYAAILLLAVPGRVFCAQLTQFLQVQSLFDPSVYGSLLAMVVNGLLGAVMIFGVPATSFDGFGFPACPSVTVFSEYVQGAATAILALRLAEQTRHWHTNMHAKTEALRVLHGLFLVEPPHAPTAPVPPSLGHTLREPEAAPVYGLNTEALAEVRALITRRRMWEFVKLYVPLSLQYGSDFWRMGVVGGIAALVSPVDVAAFNASYKILYVALAVVGSAAVVVSMRVGLKLGAGDAKAARLCAWYGIAGTLLQSLFFTVVIYVNSETLSEVFSSDPAVRLAFKSIRQPLAVTVFFMNFSIALETVPVCAGYTTATFLCGCAGSWLFQVPCVYYFYLRYNSLAGIYWGVAVGYFAVCVMYSILIASINWNDAVQLAQLRASKM
eukprot:Rhum_TRINITY_DN5433_c0_g2::Rhum_TRINITY_DN5433_c0_g2_i1::g.17424::m.17424/K03327/TC.MATE, SLC47A, norM, mdtK, dinF; multidrug resistance protein, MATE family